MYSVQVLCDETSRHRRKYATPHWILTEEDAAVRMSTVLMDKAAARKLMMHLLLSHPPEQQEGWVSISMVRHSTWKPYPAQEIIETVATRRSR